MPVDDDISVVSKSDLRTRLYECHQAQAAERLAQRKAMMAGALADTGNDISFYAAQIHASETAIQKLDKDMATLGKAMRERASPKKTRPPAAKPSGDGGGGGFGEPTSKSQAADQKEPSFGAANASTAPTDRPIKEQENNQVSRTATSSPKVRGPPAPNVRYEPAQTKKALAFAKAEAELKLYLANSPIKDTHRKEFVDAEIARTAPASPLHHARCGPMVKVRSRPTSPRGKPRAASPNFRKAMETMNVVSRSVNPLVNPRASIAPGPAPAGGV